MANAMQISHDAFSRECLMRETVKPVMGQTCRNCGNLNRNGKLFHYYSDRDRLAHVRESKLFCSIGCFRAY